jgi:hypothetical protein
MPGEFGCDLVTISGLPGIGQSQLAGLSTQFVTCLWIVLAPRERSIASNPSHDCLGRFHNRRTGLNVSFDRSLGERLNHSCDLLCLGGHFSLQRFAVSSGRILSKQRQLLNVVQRKIHADKLFGLIAVSIGFLTPKTINAER